MTFLWVLWHRVRGHWVNRSGWMIRRGKSKRIWSCWTCYDMRHFDRRSQREGWAPKWIEWRERG